MTIPKGIVGQDECTGRGMLEQHLVVLHILPFVAIHEHEVKHLAQARHLFEGITDVEAHLVAIGRALYPGAGEVFQLIVNLVRMEQGSLLQSFGHAESRVAGKGANFEHTTGTGQLYQHLEQSALQVSRGHTGIDEFHMSLTIERLQVVALLIHVLQDICLYCLGMGHNANIASIASRYESIPNPPITPTQAPVMSDVWR